MNREDVIQNLLRTYQAYGVTRAWIEQEINSGLSHAFSYQTIYTGLRMALGNVFHEPEYFTVEEMAEALGETPEAILEEIEQLRANAAACGEDPDQYAIPIHPNEGKRFLILPGELK